jgi:8-oxo-dGTP pyrophosphatase MutT (NUDIX family)
MNAVTDKSPYTTLASRYLWQSCWYNLRQDHLRAPDGSELTYTVVEKPGAVWVVPVTTGGDLVLIEQYRYAIDGWCLEVPAGNIEPGHAPAAMAARELREEIGGTAGQVVPVAEFFTMNGIGDEVAHVFLALEVTLAAPEREATEHIRLRQVPVPDGLRMARQGIIKDGPSALAILLSETALLARQEKQQA